MVKRISLAAVTEVDASHGKAVVIGFDKDNRPVEIELDAKALSALIPNLVSAETEIQGERDGKELGLIFYYGGFEVRQSQDQGYAILVLQCLAARPDRPPRKIGFRISAGELEYLAQRCAAVARSPLLSSGRKPS